VLFEVTTYYSDDDSYLDELRAKLAVKNGVLVELGFLGRFNLGRPVRTVSVDP